MILLINESLVRDRSNIPTHLEIEAFSTHLLDPILMTTSLTATCSLTSKTHIDILGGDRY